MSADVVLPESTQEGTIEDRLWAAMVCLAPYRLHSGMRADYKREITTRLTEFMGGLGSGNQSFSLNEFVGTRGNWEQNKDYSRLVAAIDMYFIRFAEHDHSKIRLCTIGARYRDCAALVGFEYIRGVTETKFGEMLMWVWTVGTYDDVKRVFEKTEELDTMHSYLPYISSMKLALKSPYSATVNPSLHHFIHFTGGLMGHQRSINAKVVGDGNVQDPLFNAQVIAFAKMVRANWAQKFRKRGMSSLSSLSRSRMRLPTRFLWQSEKTIRRHQCHPTPTHCIGGDTFKLIKTPSRKALSGLVFIKLCKSRMFALERSETIS